MEDVTYGDVFSRFLEHYETQSLGALLLLTFVAAMLISHYRTFWFDELFTMLVASQPDFHSLSMALAADGNPPLLHLIVRALIPVFGHTTLSARLPSMLGFVFACLGVYVFVRRRCGVLAGMLAVVLLVCEPGWSYAYEARPYGLLIAFLMLTMVSWQTAASRRGERRLALIGMVIGIAACMLSHHVGLIECGLPILFGETMRWYRTRRFDWRLYSTFLIAAPVLAITLPMMRRTREQLQLHAPAVKESLSLVVFKHDWLKNAWLSLPLILELSSALLIGCLVLASWRRPEATVAHSERADDTVHIPTHEIAAAVGAALLIPVTLVIMMSSTGYYNCRYGIGSMAGIAILAAFGMAKVMARRRDVTVALIVFFVILFMQKAVREVHRGRLPVNAHALPHESSDLPIVLPDPFEFFPTWWYASDEQRDRLHYLADQKVAIQNRNTVPEVSLMLERGRFPAHLDQYSEFVASHPHFLVYFPGNQVDGSFVERLMESGYRVNPLKGEAKGLYDVQRTPS